MATPRKYFLNSDSDTSEGSGNYAEKRGFLLEFTDVRNSDNYISFIAFLTSFSQNFNSNWNTEEVMGRMDPIATFKNTTRTISVGWDVPAGDFATAKDNLGRCNKLITLLYPSYVQQGRAETNALAMSKPPLIRMKYSNLIAGPKGDGLLGFITSCDWTPVLEMGYFGNGKDIYPKTITLSISFQVLHEVTTGYDEKGERLMGKEFPFRGASIDDILGGK